MDAKKRFLVTKDFVFRGAVYKEGTIVTVRNAKVNVFGLYYRFDNGLEWVHYQDPIMQFLKEVEEV